MTGPPRSDMELAQLWERLVQTGMPEQDATDQVMRLRSGGPTGTTPPPEVERPGFVRNVLASGLQGATLGYSDELGAAVRSLPRLMPGGRSFGDAYAENVAAAREGLEMAREDDPIASRVAELGGGIASSLLLPAARGAKVGRLLGEGAAYGAVAGAGTTEGGLRDRLRGAAVGGAAGAAGAGALGAAARALRPRGDTGKRILLRNLARDGVTLPEIAALRASTDKPGMLMDYGGRNVSDLAKVVGQVPGKGKSMIPEALHSRAAGAEERLIGDLIETSGQDQRFNILDSIDELAAQRESAAEEAFSKLRDVPVQDSRIRELFQLDRFRKAYERARAIGADRNAARALRGEAPLPDLPPIDGLGDGPIPFGVLEQVKRGLDDLLDVGRRSPADAGGLGNTSASALRDLKNAFVDVLDDRVPGYREARSAFAGKSAMIEAMEAGQNLFKMKPAEAERLVRLMGDSEREAFRKGAIEALADRIEHVRQGHDIGSRIGGRTVDQKRLRLLFPDENAFNTFRDRLRQEVQFAHSKNAKLGGSDTVPKAAVLADLAGLDAGPLADVATGGGLGRLASSATRAALGKIRERGISKSADELAPLLTAGGDDYDGLRRALAKLEVFAEMEEERATNRLLAGRVAGLGSGLAAGRLANRDTRP